MRLHRGARQRDSPLSSDVSCAHPQSLYGSCYQLLFLATPRIRVPISASVRAQLVPAPSAERSKCVHWRANITAGAVWPPEACLRRTIQCNRSSSGRLRPSASQLLLRRSSRAASVQSLKFTYVKRFCRCCGDTKSHGLQDLKLSSRTSRMIYLIICAEGLVVPVTSISNCEAPLNA